MGPLQRPGTSKCLLTNLLVWAWWRGEIWREEGVGQGPWHRQTLKTVSLLCKTSMIPAQDEAPFLLKLK